MNRLVLLRAACLPFEALHRFGGGPITAAATEYLAAHRDVVERSAMLEESLFAAAGPPSDDDVLTRVRFALLRVRRAVHAHRNPRANDVADATPLLDPLLRSRLHEYQSTLERLAAAESAHRSSYVDAAADARRALCDVAADPLIQHGMELASRSLVPKARRLAGSNPTGWRHEDRHTAAKAASYIARFATKTSPNGVFCAVAAAWAGGTEAWVRGEGGVARTEILLSLAEVRKVTACLAAEPAIADAVVPRPNPTLRESAGEWTWWKPATPRQPTDDEVHARAKDQPVLRAFIEEAGRGVHTTRALVGALAARTGVPEIELFRFFARLVETGILIGELEVPWSSRRRFRDLGAWAAKGGAQASWIETLDGIEDDVDRIATLPFEARLPAMERVVQAVGALPRHRPFRPDELFRVDSATSLDVRVPERVIDDLRQAMSRFTPLLAALYPQEVQHRLLIRRFLEHQPPDVDVPFLDVYGSMAERTEPDRTRAPLMEFLDPGPEASAHARRVFDWFVSRAADPGDEVEVTLDAGAEPRWMAGVLFQVAARSAADITAGRYRIAINAVFNGVGLALSRFAHLLRSGPAEHPVEAELRRAWSTAARPGAMFAELTYNHEARTANAGLRPVLFDREIELPGDRVSDGVQRHPLSDLVIRYDTATDRLVLSSLSAGLEIIPVLTSGVSPSGIVSTLIHIGRQGTQPVGYLPGFRVPGIVHWPRFRCGRVVLFRERWVFDREQLPRADSPSEADYHLDVARWREAYRLPRHVFVHTSIETKPFYVDLESPVLVDLLHRAGVIVAEHEGARMVITEMFPGPTDLWVRDAAGSYATEFLIQLEGPARAAEAERLAETETAARV